MASKALPSSSAPLGITVEHSKTVAPRADVALDQSTESESESESEAVAGVDLIEKPKLKRSLVEGLLDTRAHSKREEQLKQAWSKPAEQSSVGAKLKPIQVDEVKSVSSQNSKGMMKAGDLEARLRRKKLVSRQEDRALQEAWFEMKVPELTDEVKDDLRFLQLRNYIDPKRFYKANDRKGLPKVFQIGTVVAGAADDRFSRLTKREKRGRFAEELLADAKVTQYAKRVYKDIQKSKANRGKKFYSKKKNKKRRR